MISHQLVNAEDAHVILDRFLTRNEKRRVHTFLMGLDDTIYDSIHSDILAHNPFLNLNKVYSILIQEKQVQTMTRGKEDN